MTKISDPGLPTVTDVTSLAVLVPIARSNGAGGFTDGKVQLGDLSILNTLPISKLATLAASTVLGNSTGAVAAPTAIALASLTAASSVVFRDVNGNVQHNNSRQGYTSTATAGGTTALVANSSYMQFFTGTLAQIVTLPDVTTLVLGHQFYIRNLSTGLVTVNSSGGSLIRILGPNTRCMFTCLAITGITAASWSAMYLGTTIVDGKTLSVNNSLTLAGTDGTTFTFPAVSGGIAVVVGTTGQVQFNNAGALAGATNVAVVSGNLGLTDVAEPAAPAANLILFSKKIANSPHLFQKNVADEARPLEEQLMRTGRGLWVPPGAGTAVPGILGYPAPVVTGFTATQRDPAVTNYFARRTRLGYVSAATAAAVGNFRASGQMLTIGSGAGVGGFKHKIRFGISDPAAVAGARMFMGVKNTGAPANVEPNTIINCIGIGHGAADTNMKIYYGGSVAQTEIDLGVNFPCNTLSVDAYELALFAPPNTQTIHWEVTRLNTGNVASGTLSGVVGTAVPSDTTLMGPWGFRTNNATALAVALDIMRAEFEICDE